MKVIATIGVMLVAVVAYAISSEMVGSFPVPRTLSEGSVEKIIDGDTTCYIAVTRRDVAISCIH